MPVSEVADSGRKPKSLSLPCFAAAILALLVFSGSFGHAFVYDDLPLIAWNKRIQSVDRLGECFTTAHWGEGNTGLYRPLVMASFALNHAVDGLDTRGYIAVNLLLHAAVSALVVVLAATLGAPRRAACAAGILFAVHPVHTEAVVWMVRRDELMCALFCILALLAHRRIGGAGHVWRWSLVSCLCLLAALLSKESAVAMLLVVPVMDALVERTVPRPWRERLICYTWLAMTFCLVLGLRALVLGDTVFGPRFVLPLENPLVSPVTSRLGNIYGASYPVRMASAVALVAEHLRLLVWPATLSVDYSYAQLPLVRSITLRFLVGIVTLAATVGGVFYLRRRAPRIAFGLAFLALTDAIASNLVVVTGTILGERMLYLPSLGFVLVFALIWERACGPRLGGKARWWIGLVVLALLAGACAMRTRLRVPVWSDAPRLWEQTVLDSPNSARAHSKFGALLQDAGEELRLRRGDEEKAQLAFALAAERLERSLEIYPERSDINLRLARTLLRLGEPQRALRYYRVALQLGCGPEARFEYVETLRVTLQRLPVSDPQRRSLEAELTRAGGGP